MQPLRAVPLLLALLAGSTAPGQTLIQHTGTIRSGATPTLTTVALTAVTLTGATSGGTLVSTGGRAITGTGICWDTAPNPTVGSTHASATVVQSGSFTAKLTGLTTGTLYFVRAYATNSAGTAYGAQRGVAVYAFTGAPQTFTVPAGVTQIQVECWGAQGGDLGTSAGGRGGYAKAAVAVTPGETATILVGEQGALSAATTYTAGVPTFNGGGAGAIRAVSSTTTSGGGASDVRLGGSTLADRIVVAGGGGGCDDYSSSDGGAGGGTTGSSGLGTLPGTGGTQSAGGTGAAGGSGDLGLGGSATQALLVALDTRLSGGGGGYYGGGLGSNGGGGGGSGYTGGASPHTTSGTSMASGQRTGHGLVVITF